MLQSTVRRYLDALGSASMAVRRRERANCQNLLKFIDQEGLVDLSPAIETWVQAAGDTGDARRRRVTTLRRLFALTPGAEADNLAAWIDANRKRLIGSRINGKVVSLHGPSPDPDRDAAEDYATQGRKYYEDGDFQRARALARRALKLDPCCLHAHALYGLLELIEDRPDAALRQFRQALVLGGDPGERRSTEGIARVLDGLGQTLLAVGCFEEAYEVYRRLRHASEEWSEHCAPVLGRTALMVDRPEDAAEWFATTGPLGQFNVLMARLACGDPFRASIAFCRGILENPFVPPELLSGAERRFEDSFDDDETARLREQAEGYLLEWGPIWEQDTTQLPQLARLWDHPATRSFLMRALPISTRNPASTRLAVFIHAAASALKKDL